jgi:hypothetical protein
MRKWKVLAVLLAVAFVAIPSFGQTNEELLRRMDAMQAQIDALATENDGLRSEKDDELLEAQINVLSERLVAGTTVKSVANPVTLTGEFRNRSGWSIGDNFFGDEHEGSWSDTRVRLGFAYDFTRDVTAFAELQAHWAWGDGVSTDGFFNGEVTTDVDMYQAWIEMRNIFNRPELSSRSGRQEIVLGNQFQFGNADWYNGWVFDASRFDWDSEAFSITGIIAKLTSFDRDFNQVTSFFTPHDDDSLYSVYFTLKTIKNNKLDLYWIYINGHGGATGGSGNFINSLGFSPGGTYYFHTVGARFGGVLPSVAAGLDYNVEGAYQFGSINPGGNDVDGWAVEAEVGLTFSKESMLRVYVRFLWAEGPDGGDSGYIPLFPNRHSNAGFRARYGIFDLIPMANVLTIQGGVSFDPAKDWTIGLGVIWATTDEDIGPIQDDYGWEIDAWVEHRYSEVLTVGAGMAVLFPDDAIEFLWGLDDDTQWLFYLQARLLF